MLTASAESLCSVDVDTSAEVVLETFMFISVSRLGG
jgi:hypothetical protein